MKPGKIIMKLEDLSDDQLIEVNIALKSVSEIRSNCSIDMILSPNKNFNLRGLKHINLTCAANGTLYILDKQGFLPEMMNKMYTDRSKYKKLMIEAQKELEAVKAQLKEMT
jgi:hypothetical protein